MRSFDAETGALLDSAVAGKGGTYMFYADGKIFTDIDAQHTQNGTSVYNAASDSLYKLTGWILPFANTGAYEIALSFPIANNKMYVRGRSNIYCYDWSVKRKVVDDVVLDPNPATTVPNQSVSFTFDLYDEYDMSYSTDGVNFTWSVIGSGSVDQNGNYSAPGTSGISEYVVLKAEKDGFTAYDTAEVIIKKNQVITCYEFDSVYYHEDPFDLHCTATSGLPLEYTYVSGPYSLSGSTITLYDGVPGNNGKIYIDQPGNQFWYPASTYVFNFVVSAVQPNDTIEPEVTKDDVVKSTIKKEFSVYPNPGKDIIYFFGIDDENSQVKLLNVLGEMVKSVSNVSYIDISALPSGIYFINYKKQVLKVLKQ